MAVTRQALFFYIKNPKKGTSLLRLAYKNTPGARPLDGGALASGLPKFLAFSQHPLNTLVQTGGPIVCIFTDFAVVTFAILDPK